MATITAIQTNKNHNQQFFPIIDRSNITALSDSDLVLLVRNGQSELFAQIVDRYQRKLYAYFFRVERKREEVEDLVQNVLLKIYENLNRYDPSREFSAWIFGIAHNTAINHVKHESLKKFISLESITSSESKPEFISLEENPDQLCIRNETNIEVDDAIKELPEKYKQVLILRYYNDKSYEEIGEILGKSISTVGTLMRRAKKKMLAQIDKTSGQMTALEVRYQ